MCWQPMETAPRNATVIILRRKHDGEALAAYWSQHSMAVGGSREHPWVTLDPTNGVNGYMEAGVDGWLPLPFVSLQAPADKDKEQ